MTSLNTASIQQGDHQFSIGGPPHCRYIVSKSGTGKSFHVQQAILSKLYMKVPVIVFDVGHSYDFLVKSCGGTLITVGDDLQVAAQQFGDAEFTVFDFTQAVLGRFAALQELDQARVFDQLQPQLDRYSRSPYVVLDEAGLLFRVIPTLQHVLDKFADRNTSMCLVGQTEGDFGGYSPRKLPKFTTRLAIGSPFKA